MPNHLPPPGTRPARFLDFACLLLLAVVMLATPARADFSGPYALTPSDSREHISPSSQTLDTWTLTCQMSGPNFPMSSFDATSAPSSVGFDTSYPLGSFLNSGGISLELTNTAVASGPLSFDYSVTELNSLNDQAGYSINGVQTTLPTGSGTVSGVMLNAGDVFGFWVGAGGGSIAYQIQSRTVLNISGFSAPTVPEPAACVWLVLGLAGCGWRCLRLRAC